MSKTARPFRPGAQSPNAVVVGLNVNGLGTVRALATRGVTVKALAVGRGIPSEYTRYCEKIYCSTIATSEDDLLESLLRVGKSLEKKAVLFVSGDIFLSVISENREMFEPYFHLPFADKETVRLILDKVRFYKFANAHGFPIANTFFPENLDDVKRIAATISYPCLLKPSVANYAWRAQGIKLLAGNGPDELIANYQRASKIHDEFVIQEVTPGPDSALSFSLTYYNRDSQPLAMFTGRKLRQYVPRFGISSMAESIWLPQIARLSEEIFSALRYQGYGSVEFKFDPRDNRVKMTEVTGRTWYPHALSTLAGINLPYLAYCDLLSYPLPEMPAQFEEGIKWIDEDLDLRSGYQYWKEGELTVMDWIRSYRGKRRYAVFRWSDPIPGVMLLRDTALALAKGVVRALLRLLPKARS